MANKVAIACQGGGSHAAFTAGVLTELLSETNRDKFDLVALSGTSGGAMCAALAWSGLISGKPDLARARLDAFWDDLETRDLLDAMVNWWAVTLARLPVTAEISPYAYQPQAEPRLRALLAKHLPLTTLPSEPALRARPKLLIGATDVLNGTRAVFHGETLRYDDLIASAAVPPLFRAVAHPNGNLYWDGLFSTNPPVREFTDILEKPDEIWVIQLNPMRRSTEPTAISDILDRRNELAGNLSLGQELSFIQKINELQRTAEPGSPLQTRYKQIAIRIVGLDLPGLDYPSKLDRDARHIERLRTYGRLCAASFFDPKSLWKPGTTVPAVAMSPA